MAILIVLLIVALPFLIHWYRLFNKRWISIANKESVVLFAIGAVYWMIIYILRGNSTMDISTHDIYRMISVHTVVFYLSIGFAFFSLIYYLFPRIFGRNLNKRLSRIHFWVTFTGLNGLGIVYVEYTLPEPGRYLEYAAPTSFVHLRHSHIFMVVVGVLVLIAQFFFLINILYSLNKNKSGTRTS